MMYSEFVNGTGCKENEHNYNIFLQLEKLYMESNITKEDVYNFGKKLVDNSKTEKEIELEKEINEKIEEENKAITYWEERADFYKNIMEDKKEARRFQKLANEHKQRVKELRFVLA